MKNFYTQAIQQILSFNPSLEWTIKELTTTEDAGEVENLKAGRLSELLKLTNYLQTKQCSWNKTCIQHKIINSTKFIF